MTYKNLTEKTNDSEVLSADDEKIRFLLGNLNRIDAPKDFDFRVKARIANAKPNDFQPRFLPVLRYVLPLGLIILISAAVVFNSVYFGDTNSAVPAIAEKRSQKETAPDEFSSRAHLDDKNILRIKEKKSDADALKSQVARQINKKLLKTVGAKSNLIAVKLNGKVKPGISRRETSAEDVSGSRDIALTASKRIINPTGIVPGKTIGNSPNAGNAKILTVEEVLSQLGIEAVFINENWTVKSVRQNSTAERSGIKTGDAVEAIDGERLTDKSLQNRKIEGKNLTITRGAEKIEISLVNKRN